MSKEALNIVKEAAREQSPSATATVNDSTSKIVVIAMLVCGVLSLVFSMLAMRESNLMERETRIMQDDLKFIRAYLSARGINIPANHHEAEEK
jgi:hypothetical protein